MYRIAWQCKLTGLRGHGAFMNYDLAVAWLSQETANWGKYITHWLEGENAWSC